MPASATQGPAGDGKKKVGFFTFLGPRGAAAARVAQILTDRYDGDPDGLAGALRNLAESDPPFHTLVQRAIAPAPASSKIPAEVTAAAYSAQAQGLLEAHRSHLADLATRHASELRLTAEVASREAENRVRARGDELTERLLREASRATARAILEAERENLSFLEQTVSPLRVHLTTLEDRIGSFEQRLSVIEAKLDDERRFRPGRSGDSGRRSE